MYRHRQINLNKVIDRFNETISNLTNQYTHQMRELTGQSLLHLSKLYGKLKKHPKYSENEYQVKNNFCEPPSDLLALLTKKDKHYQEEQNNEETFGRSGQNKQCWNKQSKRKSKKKSKEIKDKELLDESQKMIKSMVQMRLQNNQHSENSDINRISFANDLNIEQMKGKTIEQIVKQSNQKTVKAYKDYQFQTEIEEEQYPLTDYSSNQSSNQNNYSDLEYKDELLSLPQNSLFGGMFSKNPPYHESSQSSSQVSCPTQILSFAMKTQSNITSGLKLKPQELLNSPKKTIMSKRLYIRQKKIPHWAEDLSLVQQIAQKQDIEEGSLRIFGTFIAQNLNSNLIFQQKEPYIRTSSAKWNQVITNSKSVNRKYNH